MIILKEDHFVVTSIELYHLIPVLCEPNVERLLTQELHQIIIMKFSHYLIGKTLSTISALTFEPPKLEKNYSRYVSVSVCVCVYVCVYVSVCVCVCV